MNRGTQLDAKHSKAAPRELADTFADVHTAELRNIVPVALLSGSGHVGQALYARAKKHPFAGGLFQ